MGGSAWADARLCLRALGPQDEEYFRRLEMDPVMGRDYRLRGITVSPESYRATLWNGVLVQHVIASNDDLRPFGLACVYAADMRNGHARLATVFTPEARSLHYPLKGIGQFINHVFDTFPLRKLYAEILDFNLPYFESFMSTGPWNLEGELLEHEYHDGRHWSARWYALYRHQWEKWSERQTSLVEADARSLLAAMDIQVGGDDSTLLVQGLGVDSLQMLEIVAMLEELAGRPLPDGVLENLRSVADLDALIATVRGQ